MKIFQNKTKSQIVISLFLMLIALGIISAAFINFGKLKEKFYSTQKTTPVEINEQRKVTELSLCISPNANPLVSQSLNEKSYKISEDLALLLDTSNKDCDLIVSDSSNSPVINEKLFIPVCRFDCELTEMSVASLTQLLGTETLGDYRLIIESSFPTKTSENLLLSTTVQRKSLDEISEAVKQDPKVIALIPFEQTKPLFKVLKVEGRSPFDKTFSSAQYPLVQKSSLTAQIEIETDQLDQIKEWISRQVPATNYKASSVKDLIMSGTSILGGRTHWFRERESGDAIFPMRGLADTFRNADIAHLSNEAVFIENCVQEEQTLSFCGSLASFEMMTFAGIDVVGLTANHELDKGREAFISTLDLYNSNNITYFGGGRDFDDAHSPKIVEIEGVKIAFLGYAFIPPLSYHSAPGLAGTAQADQIVNGDKLYMKKDIETAKQMADFIVIDMQWGEEYIHESTVFQQEYGRAAIDYGADVINGVHAHVVQGIEYYGDGIIFYGLGNTLFDQLREEVLREAILVRHVFYEGRYMGYEIMPTFTEANLQTLLASGDRKDKILRTVYRYSLINF